MKRYLLLFLKGLAMGAADMVPGVSGGTVAFISGIYDELLESLRRITPDALKVLFRHGLVAFWQHINGTFLLTLFCGVLVSIFTLANLVTFLMENYPLLVWGFFFGLVLASIIYIGRQLPLNQWPVWGAILIGAAIALAISLVKPAHLPGYWWVMMLAGSIAICAMILPGVSGSFLLLLAGLYQALLAAVASFDVLILLSFSAGCVVGLLAFSHVLSWLLRHYRSVTMGVLTGFLVGSLNIIWPWKETLETFVNRHGEEIPLLQQSVLPTNYSGEPQVLGVVLLMVIGLVLVLGLEALAGRGQPSQYSERR